MPDSLLALAILVVAIAPGFLYLRGYYRGRAQPAAPDIFVLARAVVVSLVFASLVWFFPGVWFIGPGDHIGEWLRKEERFDHIDEYLAVAWAVLPLAFGAGLAVGWLVEKLAKKSRKQGGRIARFLDWSGFVEANTVWDIVLERLGRDQHRLLEIRLKSGARIIGALDEDTISTSDLSEIVLPETYRISAEGNLVPLNQLVYLKGEDIREIAIGPSP